MTSEKHDSIGIGATSELSLRVSVASLVRVLFSHPADGRSMLALERIATLREVKGQPVVVVRAKPFGGGVRLTNPDALRAQTGDFHYDSDRSRREKDFRVLIHPSGWPDVKEICRDYLSTTGGHILDASPDRELAEEFEDTLHVKIRAEHYDVTSMGMAVEDVPAPTESVRSEGMPTVRVYYLFEAWMRDSVIIDSMMANYREYSDADLQHIALSDAKNGGKGRANAVFVAPLDDLLATYRAIPIARRGEPVRFGEHRLDGNVRAVLHELEQPKYQRFRGNTPTR